MRTSSRTFLSIAVLAAAGALLVLRWRAPSRAHPASDDARAARLAAAAKHPWFRMSAPALESASAETPPADTADLELRGVVLDAMTRAPVPRAEVRFYRHERADDVTTADDAGRFLMPPPSVDPNPWMESVAARADGYAPGITWIDAGNRGALEILLDRAVTIAGHVADPQGRGIPGVDVVAEEIASDSAAVRSTTVRTGDDGAFRIVDAAPRPMILEARGPYGTADLELAAPRPGSVVENVVIPFDPAGRIRGIVRAEGVPVANARVSVGDASTHTAEDGSFELPGLEPGDVMLRASEPAHGSAQAHVTVVANTDAVRDLDLDRGAILSGTVEDEAGAPVEGAEIEATCEADAAVVQTTSARSGRFDIAGLPCATASLGIRKRGFVPVAIERAAIPSERTIRLSRGLGADVRIVDARGAPILSPDVFVFVTGSEHQTGAGVVHTHLGIARVDGLVDGEYDAEVFDGALGAGHARFRAGVPRTRVPIEVSGMAVITGRLSDERGRPIAGAFVGAAYVQDGRIRLDDAAWESRSDAGGAFRVHAPATSTRILAVAPGLAPLVRDRLVLRAGETVDVGTLVLGSGDGSSVVRTDEADDAP